MSSGETTSDPIPDPSDVPDPSPGDDAPSFHLNSLWRAQLWFTLMPGAIGSSPLVFLRLSKWVPVVGVLALVTALPALLIAVYFLPTVLLIRRFMPYEPSTLKEGSLLPLPADSPASWTLVLTVHAAIVALIWMSLRIGAAASRRN
jgi:hypothetical protein